MPKTYRLDCIDDFLDAPSWEGQDIIRNIILTLIENHDKNDPLNNIRKIYLNQLDGNFDTLPPQPEQLTSHRATALQLMAQYYAAHGDIANATAYAVGAAFAFFDAHHIDHGLSLLAATQDFIPFDPMHYRLRADGYNRLSNDIDKKIKDLGSINFILKTSNILSKPWNLDRKNIVEEGLQPKNTNEIEYLYMLISMYASIRPYASNQISTMVNIIKNHATGTMLARTCFIGAFHTAHTSTPNAELHRDLIRRYWEVAGPHHPEPFCLPLRPNQERLRVGFVDVSGATLMPNYYRTTIGPSLAALSEKNGIETFFYLPGADSIPEHLAQHIHHVRIFPTSNDLDNASQDVLKDDLDVLIMISGLHSQAPTILFASHPARRLALWHHTHTSFGPELFDAVIIDSTILTPSHANAVFETPIPINAPAILLAPPPNAPNVSPAPRLTKGHIAFGSFNRVNKMTPHILTLWRRILFETPNSVLHFANNQLFTEDFLQQLKLMMKEVDFPQNRVIFHTDPEERVKFMQLYDHIDILLDTYPFNGGLTTIESLWQGVPVITRADDSNLSRTSLHILARIGLDDLVAFDDDTYVNIACRLTEDGPRLDTLRTTLRGMLLQSPLMNPAGFADRFEDALRRVLHTPLRRRAS